MDDASAEYEYVGTCFLVVAVLRTCCLRLTRTPSPFHMRRRHNGKDEDDAEVSPSESECPPQPPPLLLCPPRGGLGRPGRRVSRRRVLSAHAGCVSMLGKYCELSSNPYTITCKLTRNLIKLVMI